MALTPRTAARALITASGLVALAACALGPPVVVPGQPAPAASFRDVFADTRSPTPGPTPSAAPSPSSGGAFRTDRPLDVALTGPGYLVVATRPDPRDWPDVAFVPGGELGLEFRQAASPLPGSAGFPVSGPGAWTLRTHDGRYVLGFELARDPDAYAPPEGRSTAFTSAFALGGVAGGGATVGPLSLDTPAGLAPDAWLDYRGRLTIAGQPPVDAEGRARFMYLAVAQVEDATKLVPLGAERRYDQAAGLVHVGIAGLPAGRGEAPRPVGDANLLRPGHLPEAPTGWADRGRR